VEQPAYAAAGLQLVREQGAGRCGFLIADRSDAFERRDAHVPRAGLIALSSVLHVNGPFANSISSAIGGAWIAGSFETGAVEAPSTNVPVATRGGDLFRGSRIVTGGCREDARGILETKREIKELEGRLASERDALQRLGEETATFESAIAQALNAIGAL